MSISALDWAFKQPIGKSSLKFVLIALANYAGPNGECYPSIPRLCFDTGQEEKTVRANLKQLCRQDYIKDTGKRVGRTKQIPIFVLSSYANTLNLNPPKNGYLPRREPSQKRSLNPPKNGTLNQELYPKEGDKSRKSVEQRQSNAVRIAELLDQFGGNRT